MKYKNTCRLAGLSSAFLFLLSCSLKKINKDQNESGNANKTPIFFLITIWKIVALVTTEIKIFLSGILHQNL